MTPLVVLADERALIRAALRALLQRDGASEVVAECTTGVEVVEAVGDFEPDVLVLDIGLLDAALISEVKASNATLRVVVLDVDPDEERLATCVESGADGYLSRLHHPEDLLDAIATVLGGNAYVPTEMLGGLLRTLIHQRREEDAVKSRFQTLTTREVEVLGCLCEGLGGDDMAERLYISAATARTHVQNVLKKLDVHSQVEAAALARRHGLLDDVGSRP